MSSRLTREQYDVLLQRIHPKRVLSRDGNAYVEGHDIKAELTRIFGFAGWSAEVVHQEMIFEQETVTKSTNKEAWYVAYRTVMKLTVCAEDGTPLATYAEGHVGDSTHPQRGEAHGNAVTNSETYALKRCAIALGDQFGLSLYNKGTLQPIVRWTLVKPEGEATSTVDTSDVPEVHAESEQIEDKRETNEPTAAPQPPPSAAPKENPELTKWVKTLMAGPGEDEPTAPFYARMHVAANKGKFLNSLVENRNGEMVSAGALLNDEQKRTQRDRAA